MKNIISIKGNKVNLCVFRTDKEAIEKYKDWLNEKEITHWLDKQTIMKFIVNHKNWLDSEIDKNKKKIKQFNIVTDKDVLIGNCEIHIDKNNISGRIGVFIKENERNKGYGTEVIKMILNHSFNAVNLYRMEIILNEEDKNTIRCFEKCGFKIIGTLHNTHRYNNRFSNSVYMEILR